MSDARIIITIDYEPNLALYPADVTTKREAMEFDVTQVMDGNIMEIELVDYADSLDWEVVDR